MGKRRKTGGLRGENKRKEWISIRTREKTLIDLEVFPGDEGRLKERCRDLNPGEYSVLYNCAKSAAHGLERAVCESITKEGEGYRTLIKKGWNIPVTEDDFYSYKRGTMAKFYHWLRMTGQWKV